jgi:transposase
MRYRERVYFEDEMRYGTRTALKRRWTPAGHRPQCPVKIAYEFGYLYCAICPFTGDLFCLLLPNMKKECFQVFIEEFEKHTAGEAETLIILDGAGCHQADTIRVGSHLALEKLPTACPELNPAERFFQELRKELANQVFETIESVEEKIKHLLETYWKEPNLIMRLTSFPYINTSNLI